MSVFPSWPWSNFHEMNLDWVLKTVKSCKEAVDSIPSTVTTIVNNYFTAHVDDTLTVAGDAADAKTVGDKFTTDEARISALEADALNIKVIPIIGNSGTYSYGAGMTYNDLRKVVESMLTEPGTGGGEQKSSDLGFIYLRERDIINPKPAYMVGSFWIVTPSLGVVDVHLTFPDNAGVDAVHLACHSDGTFTVI